MYPAPTHETLACDAVAYLGVRALRLPPVPLEMEKK